MSGRQRGWGEWLERRSRRWHGWYGRRFRSEQRPAKPEVRLFCDFEGHFAGEDGERFADAGTERLLEILARHRVRMTFDIVAELCRLFPERVRRVAAAGHEIACHGFRHERPRDLDPNALEKMLQDTIACFREIGLRPTGFRSPESAWSTQLMKRLPAHGYSWSAERDIARAPYRICDALIRVPVRTDDWDLADRTADAARLIGKWRDDVQDAIQTEGLVSLGLHEWIVGREGDFANRLDAFLGELRSDERIALKTLGGADAAH